MADQLPVVMRPNGTPYQPRKLVVESWDNQDSHGGDCGVFVLGTHNTDRAYPLAADAVHAFFGGELDATKPELCWVRSGYQHGEPSWVHDDVRGRAAVQWTADYPAEATDASS